MMSASQGNNLRFEKEKHERFLRVPNNVDPIELADRFDAFPLRTIKEHGRTRLLVAMTCPENLERVADIEFFLGISIIPVEASRSDLTYLEQAYHLRLKLQSEEDQALQDFGFPEESEFRIKDWT